MAFPDLPAPEYRRDAAEKFFNSTYLGTYAWWMCGAAVEYIVLSSRAYFTDKIDDLRLKRRTKNYMRDVDVLFLDEELEAWRLGDIKSQVQESDI